MRYALLVICLSLLLASGCKKRSHDADEQPQGEIEPPPVMAVFLKSLDAELKRDYPRATLSGQDQPCSAAEHYWKATQTLIAIQKASKGKSAKVLDAKMGPVIALLKRGLNCKKARSPFAIDGVAYKLGFRDARKWVFPTVAVLADAGFGALQAKPSEGLTTILLAVQLAQDLRRGAPYRIWFSALRIELAMLARLSRRLNQMKFSEADLARLHKGLALLEQTSPTFTDALRLWGFVFESKVALSFKKDWQVPRGLIGTAEKASLMWRDVRKYREETVAMWKNYRIAVYSMIRDANKRSWGWLNAQLQAVAAMRRGGKRAKGPMRLVAELNVVSRGAVSTLQRLRALRTQVLLQRFYPAQKKFPLALNQLQTLAAGKLPLDPVTGKLFGYQLTDAKATLTSPQDLAYRRPRRQRRRGKKRRKAVANKKTVTTPKKKPAPRTRPLTIVVLPPGTLPVQQPKKPAPPKK